MKVVHVVRQFSPAVGGLEDATLHLTKALGELGVQSSVVTLDRLFTRPDSPLSARTKVDGIPVIRIPWRGSKRYPIAPSVLRHIKDADIVHVHAVDFFFDLLALTKRRHKKPLVGTTNGGFFHTGFMAKSKRLWFNTITRMSARCYDRVVACSQSDAETFAPLCPNNLRTIENGVDIAKFRLAAPPSITPNLIYFGRFAPNKRLKALFPLLAWMRGADPRWTLTIAGACSARERSALEQEVLYWGLNDAVTIVRNPSIRDLRNLISRSSFYVGASSYEGFGLAAVEALSAGLFPVLSDIPPFRKLVSGLDNAVLFDPEKPLWGKDAGSRLMQLYSKLDGRTAIAQAELFNIASRYGWADPAKAYRDLYSEVLAETHTVPRSTAEALP